MSSTSLETTPTVERTRHAIILAAGFGSRLQPEAGHKLLERVGGRPMLDYHLDRFAHLGVDVITIVTGYAADALESSLADFERPDGPELRVAHNPDFERSNGLSVLAGVDGPHRRPGAETGEALPCPTAPFWLTMSDHLLEPVIVEDLRAGFEPDARIEGALCVDRKIDTLYDVPDANKLRLDDRGHLEAIGKDLDTFQLADVGLFWCDGGFVEALRAERAERGDCSTSDAVVRLAADDRFELWDIGQATWQDIDTPGAHTHAEELLESW
jgi:choline kinase